MMDPILKNNALWALATLIYVKVIVVTCDYLMNSKIIPSDVSRKIIHIAACSWCLFWPQFEIGPIEDESNNWQQTHSWKFNVAIPALYSVQLLVKGAILRDPNDQDVKTMSRTGNPTELLYGPFLFTLIMMFCGLQEFKTLTGISIMGALVGDGIAPLVGKRYPILPYTTLGGDTKTMSGSVGMFVGSVLGITIYSYFLLESPTTIPGANKIDLESTCMTSLLATIAEAVTGGWDNPAIAFVVYWFVKATDIQIRI